MVNTYYKSEYTEKQWIKLIDEASHLRCKIEYSKYGNTCTIDSTETETELLVFTNNPSDSSQHRKFPVQYIVFRGQHILDKQLGAAIKVVAVHAEISNAIDGIFLSNGSGRIIFPNILCRAIRIAY